MKKIIFMAFAVLSLGAGIANAHKATSAQQQLFKQGKEAYEKGQYQAAIEAWKGILAQGQESNAVYYNLGNAYYRTDDIAHAILNYERALRLKPHDNDARQNLELAYSKTEDKIDRIPELFFVRWWRAVIHWFSPRGWMWVCIAVLALFTTLLASYLLGRTMRYRRKNFIATVAIGVVLIFCGTAATFSSQNVSTHQEAIVMAPATVVRSSPDQGGVDKMVLHAGTHLRLEEADGQWTKVRIADGNYGWMPNKDFEVI